MPESATSIFSMVPTVSVKGRESGGEKSTLGGDTTSKNPSSFSSELSLAGDRQRNGFAENEVADVKPVTSEKQTVKTGTEEKSKLGTIKPRAVADNMPTPYTTSRVIGAETGDNLKNADLTLYGVPSSETESEETLPNLIEQSRFPVKLQLDDSQVAESNHISPSVVDEALNSVKAFEHGAIQRSVGSSISQEPIEGDQITDVEFPDGSLPVIERSNNPFELTPVSLESTTVNNELKSATDTTLPIVGLAIGTNTAEPTKPSALQGLDTLVSSSGKATVFSEGDPGSTASSVPPQGLITPPASQPQSVVTQSTDGNSNIVAFDKRLGRWSSKVEPFDRRQPDNTVALAETENTIKIDTNAVGVRSRSLGLDGEKVLNPSLQSPGDSPTLEKGDRSKGILVSDLALPRDSLPQLKDTQRLVAGVEISRTRGTSDDVDATFPLTTAQILASTNHSNGKTEAIVVATKGGLHDVVNTSTGMPTLDHMLAASTSGIVTAPTQGRVELTNMQGVSTSLQAPLNVPLLTSNASEGLSGNIRWMVGEGIQNATVSVTPSGMGPITVQIGVEKEQMSISIVAAQASTREALEATLPRLREQLGTQGLDSIRVDISDGRSDQSKSNTGSDRQSMGGNTTDAQGQSAENSKNENSSARSTDSEEYDSGERILSETERDLLARLQGISTDPSVTQTTIRHGYDLYV